MTTQRREYCTSFLIQGLLLQLLMLFVFIFNVKGRVDSSGVRIYYTDKLRKYDSGIVSVGVRVNNWHIIPPKQKDWLSIGYCTAECTEVWYHLILCGA